MKPFSLFAHGGAQGRVENEGGADESRKQSRGIRPRRYVVRRRTLCVHTRPVGTVGKGGKKRNMNVSFRCISFFWEGSMLSMATRVSLFPTLCVCHGHSLFFFFFPFMIIIFSSFFIIVVASWI